MSVKLRLSAAFLGASALLALVGVDVAQAGSFPKGGTYHVGGEGVSVEPSPDPLSVPPASFSPSDPAQPGCGTAAWGGGCG